MKKLMLYVLLFSGIIFISIAYIYRQYQYNRFEELFMGARIYGNSKIVSDTVLNENNKKLGLDVKKYKYLFFLKNRNESFSREFYTSMS